MPSSFFVFKHNLLPMNSVALGRLVIDTSTPWQDFCPNTEAPGASEIGIVPQPRLRELFERTKGSKIHDSLCKVFCSLLRNENVVDGLSSAQEKTYYLLNSGPYFSRLCGNQQAREWFETTIKHGWNVYMVVGIHTVHESSVHAPNLDQIDRSVFSVPHVGSSVQQAEQEVGLTVSAGNYDGGSPSPRELIIAVQYRKVQFKWFSSRKMDAAFLEVGQNRWKVFAIGGRAERNEDEEDIVEADLQDEIEAEEIEEEGDAYFTTDEGIIVQSS